MKYKKKEKMQLQQSSAVTSSVHIYTYSMCMQIDGKVNIWSEEFGGVDKNIRKKVEGNSSDDYYAL